MQNLTVAMGRGINECNRLITEVNAQSLPRNAKKKPPDGSSGASAVSVCYRFLSTISCSQIALGVSQNLRETQVPHIKSTLLGQKIVRGR